MQISGELPFYVEVIPQQVSIECHVLPGFFSAKDEFVFLQRVQAYTGTASGAEILITRDDGTPLPAGRYLFSASSFQLCAGDYPYSPCRLQFQGGGASYVPVSAVRPLLHS